MKPPLLFATLSLILASPVALGKSELEILRSRCLEQERQIRLLEDENTKLRTDGYAGHTSTTKTAPAPPVAPKSESPTATTASTYTVKSGDSWEKISSKLGLTSQKLAKANGLKSSSIIHPGQKLKVPGAATVTTSTAPEPTPSVTSGKTYQVQAGETFSSISKKHGISTQSLIDANPKVKPAALRPGQVVNLGSASTTSTTMIAASKTTATVEKSVPADRTPMTHKNIPVSTAEPISKPASLPQAKSEPAPATANQPVAKTESPPPPANKIRPVTINGEMTYGEFATQYGTDTTRLNALNGLDLTTATILAKGSELYVPAQP